MTGLGGMIRGVNKNAQRPIDDDDDDYASTARVMSAAQIVGVDPTAENSVAKKSSNAMKGVKQSMKVSSKGK